MVGQLSLFEEKDTSSSVNVTYLNIVKDNKPTSMSIQQLFDPNVYEEIKAVSFVASPNFFFSTVRDFKKVTLIFGIEDSEVSNSFATGLAPLLDIEKRIEFFSSLPQNIQEHLRTENFSIRYSKQGNAIHSKIYLLRGSDENRVIIGSANFTQTAFNNKKQFEEIIVFDNSPLFEVYEKRFEEIYSQTVDYIPESIKKKKDTEKVWLADPEVFKEILLDEVVNDRIVVQLSEEEMEEIKLAPDKVEVERENAVKYKQIIEVMTKKNKKTNRYEMIPVGTLKQKSVAIKTVYSKTNKKSIDLDNRFTLEYHDGNDMLLTKKSNNPDENELIPFSKPIEDVEKMKESLNRINKFVDAYELFTARTDVKNQSRIFEIIVYSFMSFYIWKMRDHYAFEEGRDSVRRHFPPFLIIAGRSMSGKTTALEFVGMLLGNTTPYLPYEEVKQSKIIYDFFHSSNVNPILIDEIEPKFFTSTASDKGERLIKYISNEKKGHHPVLIGTTNATGFDVTAQTSMRIYYLQIDNTFKKEVMAESSKYLSEIMNNIDSSLFQDFSYRMGQLIHDGMEFYQTDDFLAVARRIFKDYYQECEMELPKWFPEAKFNDYDERGKFIWRQLYQSHKDAFDIREDNSILIKMEEMGNKTYKDRTNKINFLPADCIIEDSPVLVVNKKLFFNFIEFDDTKDQSFLTKIKKVFKKS